MKNEIVTSGASPQNAFDALAPWVYDWPGVKSGSKSIEGRRPKLDLVNQHAGPFHNTDILELGPNEGEVTYLLEGYDPRSITAIECRPINFVKCLAVKNQYGLNRTIFLLGDFEQFLEQSRRHFDVVVAIGVLYHMVDPLRLLAAIAAKSDRIALGTITYDREKLARANEVGQMWTLRPEGDISATIAGFTARYYRHEYAVPAENLKYGVGGVVPHAHFMTAEEIVKAIEFYGHTVTYQHVQDEQNGPHLWVASKRR